MKKADLHALPIVADPAYKPSAKHHSSPRGDRLALGERSSCCSRASGSPAAGAEAVRLARTVVPPKAGLKL